MATIFTNQATLNYNGTMIRSNIATGILEGLLWVTKEALQDSYAAEDTLTYVVSIVNKSDTSATAVSVNDNLGAYVIGQTSVEPLDYVPGSVQYYSNGVRQDDPAVSTANGLEITGLTVPANGNIMLIYAAKVNEFAPLDTDGEIINTVTVEGLDIADVTASQTVSVTNASILSVIKSVSPIPVAENGELTYTFQLENAGNTAVTEADNATISDTFDPVLTDIHVIFNGEKLQEGTDYTYDENTGLFETVDGVISIPAATFAQDETTGVWTATPGSSTLIITGTV